MAQHWERWYCADHNLIENNVITTGPTVTNPSVALDRAADNVIRGSALGYLSYGIRVEDDGTRVEGNSFGSGVGPAVAVLVGTKSPTTELDRPVERTVLTGNTSNLPTNPAPFRWIWEHASTTESANTANAAASALIEGSQPPINPFIFAIRIWTP